MLHLQGLVPGGLAAALLACGGLTKVKLHLSLRSLLPELLIRHVEARGCVFEWRDKEFQVYFCLDLVLRFSKILYPGPLYTILPMRTRKSLILKDQVVDLIWPG